MIKLFLATAVTIPALALPAFGADQSVCYYRPSVDDDWTKASCQVEQVTERDSRDTDGKVLVWYVKRDDSPFTLRFLPWKGGKVEISVDDEQQTGRWSIDDDDDYRVTLDDGSQFTWRPIRHERSTTSGPRLRPGMLQGTPFRF